MMKGELKDYDSSYRGHSGDGLRTVIYILLGVIAILLGLIVLKNCTNVITPPPIEIAPTPPDPDLGHDEIVPSPDSLGFEVNKRIILVIQNQDKTKDEFVRAFYKVYTDKDKYILTSPDDIIPRFVLTLPPDEKQAVQDVIASQFPEFDLLILPDTIFSSGSFPSDPDFSDAHKRWYFDMIGVEEAWKDTKGDKDLIVAVIDNGFDLSHPEFAGKVVMPYNAVYHNSEIFFVPDDGGVHGTHVAATAIGNSDNSSGLCGIAPDCKFMPIQVGDASGNMAISSIIDGVLYAITQGASVVNMSLGRQWPDGMELVPIGIQKSIIDNYFLDEEIMWRKIFGMGIDKGITFVIAGGNENILIGMDPMDRIEGTIRVSAVQASKYKADFSNFGSYSVLSAPGVEIYNAVPGDKYMYLKGTSMASPIVAGCVALMKSKNPSLTNEDIISILQKTGIPSPSDVGPIVNFKKAMEEVPGDGMRPVPDPGDDMSCEDVNKRYQQLLEELERLKREHPGCIAPVDTMVIPPAPTLDEFDGLWKSTTPIYSEDGEELTLYYAFNRTSNGKFTIVDEAAGKKYEASLVISIVGDNVHIVQTEPAVCTTDPTDAYSAYETDLKPNAKTRKAECEAVNQMNPLNRVHFNLIRIK